MRILSFTYFIALSALALSIAACSSFQRSDDAEAAQKRMRGLSREDVLACMGPARKKASEGTTEVWNYLSTDGHGESNGGGTKISGLAKDVTVNNNHSEHDRSFCFVNVVMKDGIVTAVHYTGPSGDMFTPYAQCGYAVANCVEPGLE